MPETELITRIRIDTVESVLKDERLLFVGCIRDDIDFQETLEQLNSVAVYSGPGLKVCFLLEDLLPYFEIRYCITGTPTFLLLENGNLVDYILGKNTTQVLMDFINMYIPVFRGIGTPRHYMEHQKI